MTFWKIQSSKTLHLLFLLKSLLLFNLTFAKLKYQYDACDPLWANDTLWLNYFLKTNGTICQDQEITFKKYPEGFVALIATAFANKNYSCGEGRLCDPAVLNRDLIRCYFQINNPENKSTKKSLFQCIGLKFFNNTLRFWELEDEVLTGFTLIAAHVLPNSNNTNNRFLIEDTYENYVRGIDYRGRSVMYPWEEIKGIEKFKILNVHREKKNKKKNQGNADDSNPNAENKDQSSNEGMNNNLDNAAQAQDSSLNGVNEEVRENESSLNNIAGGNNEDQNNRHTATAEEVRKESVQNQGEL